jgi:hypothetical protein
MERKRKDTQLRDRLEALEKLPAKTRKDLIGVLDAVIEAYNIERVAGGVKPSKRRRQTDLDQPS